MSNLANNYYTYLPDDADAPLQAPSNFSTTTPVTTLSVNRLWARYIVSAMATLSTNEGYWADAGNDSARQRILIALQTFINGL